MSELTVARNRATSTGIPHYVFTAAGETWIAGARARAELWPDREPIAGFGADGRRLHGFEHDAHDACPIHEGAYRLCGCP